MKILTLFLSTLPASAFCLFSINATASTIYQTGFEAPTITTGLLNGQDNWSASGSGATTVVETAVVHSGSQAVILTPGSSPNTYGSQHSDPVSLSSNSILSVSDYVLFSSTGTATYWTALGTFYLAGGNILMNVDPSGEIILSINGTNTDSGLHVSTGAWTQLGLTINYANGTVTPLDNGTAGSAVAFNDVTDLALNTFQFYSQSNSATTPQVAYFDDVSISTATATPEPASLFTALTTLAVLGLAKSFRR